MSASIWSLAFGAGTLAAVNPCGFALLPAYLGLFVAGREGAEHPRPLRRAVVATAAMTAGFMVVFGAFGLVVAPLALSVGGWLPWATVGIGVLLVGIGGWLIAGRELTVRTPKFAGRADPTGSALAMAGYGVSFAIASLSCTVGPFLAVTTTAFRRGSVPDVLTTFLAYAAGMGAVVGAVTFAVAASREALVHRLRAALPLVGRIGGGLLLFAGAYAIYYGIYEVRVAHGAASDPIVDTAIGWQTAVERRLADLPGWQLVTSATVLAAILALLARTRSRRVDPSERRADRAGPSDAGFHNGHQRP